MQGRGSCPQGHGPHNQVHIVRTYRQRHVINFTVKEKMEERSAVHVEAAVASIISCI